jgi:NAD(P) transhydrogenase subunit alpha
MKIISNKKNHMTIGILKCTKENLIAMVPQVVSKLIKSEYSVLIETNAGKNAGYSNELYKEAGAEIVSRNDVLTSSDIILTGVGIEVEDIHLIKENTLLIGKFNARVESEMLTNLKYSEVKVFSLDLLPRSSIAQSMDVLSSLASLSGYKAVIAAGNEFSGYLSMMTTSAGTIPPAKVLILGAGVAGLQAIATAKRLGAVVNAFDVRASVKEEVESLGAKFIEVEGYVDDKNAGGYAVKQSEDYIHKQKELIHETAIKADIIITTANIPGRKAPILIENKTVKEMKPGSVIVDMATTSGGNCELSKDNDNVIIDDVVIIGDSILYNKMGKQASLLYSNNIHNFLKYILKNGIENIPYDSDIVTNTLLQKESKLVLN